MEGNYKHPIQIVVVTSGGVGGGGCNCRGVTRTFNCIINVQLHSYMAVTQYILYFLCLFTCLKYCIN